MKTLPLLIICFLTLVSIPQAQADFDWVKFEQGRYLTIPEPFHFKEGECTETMTMLLSFENTDSNYSIYFKLFPVDKNSIYLQDGWSVIINFWAVEMKPFTIYQIIYDTERSDGEKTNTLRIQEPGKYAISISVCPGNNAKDDTFYEAGIIIALKFEDKEMQPAGNYNQSHGIWFTYTLEKEKIVDWTITIILLGILVGAILITAGLFFKKEEPKEKEPPVKKAPTLLGKTGLRKMKQTDRRRRLDYWQKEGIAQISISGGLIILVMSLLLKLDALFILGFLTILVAGFFASYYRWKSDNNKHTPKDKKLKVGKNRKGLRYRRK